MPSGAAPRTDGLCELCNSPSAGYSVPEKSRVPTLSNSFSRACSVPVFRRQSGSSSAETFRKNIFPRGKEFCVRPSRSGGLEI